MDVPRIQRLQALGGNSLTVLPGIEFRTELGGKETIHMIGIFPEDCGLESVWTKLQGQLALTPHDIAQKTNEGVYVPFAKAADLIHSLGGLVSVHAGRKNNSFENIGNNEGFKMTLKGDLVREHIDFFEIGRKEDEANYRQYVFPSIGLVPLVSGSDCHNIAEYTTKLPLWVKADPTFRGLKQILTEPESRVYLGAEPPQIERIRQNGTKYIRSVTIRKMSGSTLQEKWFDCRLPLNAGLVAIIGNKGNGKSALADILGLLGDTRQHKHFSFLNPSKFRSGKAKRAESFEASLEWAAGKQTQFKALSDVPSSESIESIKYLPQSYVESVCNEISAPDTRSSFDVELANVIYSHVPTANRLGLSSLDELIRHKTEETHAKLRQLRYHLATVNEEVAILEEMQSPGYAIRLNNEQSERSEEVAAHLSLRPAEVVRPELDKIAESRLGSINEQIEVVRTALAGLRSDHSFVSEEQAQAAFVVTTAKKLLARVRNLKSSFDVFESESLAECEQIGVSLSSIVTIFVDEEILRAKIESARVDLDTASRKLDRELPSAIPKQIGDCESQLLLLSNELDVPGRKYQEFLVALQKWEAREVNLVGDEFTPGTLKYVGQKLKEIDDVPQRLIEHRKRRLDISRSILDSIISLCGEYRELYSPVQQFVAEYAEHDPGIELNFKVSLQAIGFEKAFLDFVNQAKRGTFYGASEGMQVLKTLMEGVDWDLPDDVFGFAELILDRLKHDYRDDIPKVANVLDQLNRSIGVQAVYDYLFGFDFLYPKYQLEWNGQPLDILSPGERGAVLLLFYLLVDKGDLPLIIDQPEENLDNQTVYRLLVPALKRTRERRQVIIVTHNPNLAVVCDADQIIYAQLNKKNNNEVSYTAGSIENPTMNRKILDVLEGTRPAFQNRGSKYHSIADL